MPASSWRCCSRCRSGLILGQSPSLNRFFSPIVYITYPIPKIVFLPVILLLFGIGDTSKIFIIFIILFFQILVVVRDQAAALRPELIYSVRSLGAGRRALFRFVYLPATVPAALTALRVSIGTAVAVLFFAESFATTSGLGYYIISDSWQRLAYPEMYAGVDRAEPARPAAVFRRGWPGARCWRRGCSCVTEGVMPERDLHDKHEDTSIEESS